MVIQFELLFGWLGSTKKCGNADFGVMLCAHGGDSINVATTAGTYVFTLSGVAINNPLATVTSTLTITVQ
jgi:hypothetical protein